MAVQIHIHFTNTSQYFIFQVDGADGTKGMHGDRCDYLCGFAKTKHRYGYGKATNIATFGRIGSLH